MRPSYVHGASATPLLGQTIGENLDRAVERWGDREALVSCHQGLRYTYAELGEAVDRLARALLAARASSPATGWASGARTAPSGCSSSTPPPRPASCSSTSTRPTARPSWSTRCASPAAAALIAAPALQDLRLRGDDRVGPRRAARARARGAPRLAGVGARWRPAPTRTSSCRTASSTTRSTSSTRAARRASPRAPRSATTTSSTTATSWPRAAATRRQDRVCIPVPFYHCFGMVMGNLGCTTHGACMVIPEAAFEPEATLRAVQEERCTSLYGVPTMFIAELEHPELRRASTSRAAHGDHGRLAVPDRDDAPRRRRDAHGGGHHLLRHDRDLARCRRRRAPTTRSTSASAPSGAIHPHVEIKVVDPETGARRRARAARRAVHPRLLRDARLLGRAREDRRGARPRALDAHGRPRGDGRRGLPADRRAHQGHGHPRRREPLPARGRGVPLRPPRRRRRAGRRRPRRALRRGADGLDRAARGRRDRPRRDRRASATARSPATRSRATSRPSTSSR